MSRLPKSEYSIIGKRLPRVDGVAKATGEAKYTADVVLPKMLHGVILRSPYPHARILNIDTSRAEKLAGVKAVVTGREITSKINAEPGVEYGLAINEVHYWGEGVAAVAAVDKDTAMEALNLIDVVYEELPAVFDPEEALRGDAPKANTELGNNLVGRLAYHWGDADKGFSQSDYTREDRFVTQSVHGGFMEPHICVADFDAMGKLTLWTSTQGPWAVRGILATKLGMREGDVRVILPYVGGGFCGKTLAVPSDIVASALSRKCGRPVKLALSRDEVLIENRGIPPTIMELKTGVKRDGTLTALQCRMIANVGAYVRAGAASKDNLSYAVLFVVGLAFPYRLPNIKFEGVVVHTNNPVYLAQRGAGITPARFACESQLDMIAADLGIDPVEIRRKNALKTGDITANKSRVTSSGLSECLQKVSERIRWKERKGKPSVNRGLGIACYAHPSGDTIFSQTSAAAFIHVHGDGTVTLVIGGVELGQGITTVMSQIVAEELGLALEDIRVTQPDTESSPYCIAPTGSRATFTVGNAVKAAVADAKRQVLQLAGEKLGAKVEELEMRGREIYVKDSPGKRIAFADLVKDALYHDGKPILGKGYHTTEAELWNWETGEGNWTPAYSFGTTAVEVEVDKETGQVKVLKATVAHDCGFALNPMLVEGQIEGQFQAGMGQTLYEQRLVEKGQLLNPTFTDYRMPRSLDMPQVESILVNSIDPRGPFGAKECGEGPQGGVAPAIANAVYDAIGVRIKELPITPEKVIEALKKKGAR